MVVVGDIRVLAEQRAVVRVLDIVLDRHQAFLADLDHDLVQQRQQLHVACLGVLGALERARQRGLDRFQRLALVADHEGADGAAQNRQHLGRQRLDDHRHVPAVNNVGAEDTAQRDHITNDDIHKQDFLKWGGEDGCSAAHWRRVSGGGSVRARRRRIADMILHRGKRRAFLPRGARIALHTPRGPRSRLGDSPVIGKWLTRRGAPCCCVRPSRRQTGTPPGRSGCRAAGSTAARRVRCACRA
ncbi:hypothetical protein D3C78_1148820 [compost metagenome]